jgi:uncharacterized surface protein with fasciclin (FAS1) repeats
VLFLFLIILKNTFQISFFFHYPITPLHTKFFHTHSPWHNNFIFIFSFYNTNQKQMNMKQTLQRLFFVTALGALVITSSCKKSDDPAPTPTPTPTPTPSVAGYVSADTSFSLLLTAVKKAGLAGTLSGAGTFTVFAPNNAAFRAAGFGTDASINALDTPTIKAIILYHALGSPVAAGSVPASDAVTTLNGAKLFASSNTNGVFLNGVKVITPNVTVSNGIIHVIGSVLLPPSKTITQIALPTPTDTTFSFLVAAVVRAGLLSTVSGPGKFTVFAPTNNAFRAAGFATPAAITAADSATVRKIVLAHVLPTNVFAGDLSAVTSPITNTANPTASTGGTQQTLTFGVTAGGVPTVKISGSSAAASNIVISPALFNLVATNGVVHVIDKVLL